MLGVMECAEKNWDLDVKHRTEKGKTAMTEKETFVVEGNENADVLVAGADVDGGRKRGGVERQR